MNEVRELGEAEIEQRLDMANSLLQSYAQDLRAVVQSEREKTRLLAAAHERLQLLDRLKFDFLVFIAHELNTPLAAIAAVEMLEAGAPLEDQRELVAIVNGGYERLHGMVEKGLEYFAWLARTSLEMSRPVALVPLLLRLADDRPVRVVAAAGVEECSVFGDDAALQRAFGVLFDNAVRFSGKPVDVLVERRQGWLHIEVQDHGIGFEPQLAEELFSPFTITDAEHHSRGSGMSLAIARVIVEAHGGELTARSQGLGCGATFCAELPVVE